MRDVAVTPISQTPPPAPQTGAAPETQGGPAPPPRPPPPAAWLENPYPHIDPGLNIVVLAFHDESGRVTRTIPSEAALASYRLHGVPPR